MASRILVIDDDPKITAFLNRTLTYEGYQVQVANDGESGLAAARESDFDLIILDLMLPRISGWDVCRRLRQESSVPILMLTARDEVADRVRGLDSGADDYIVKPFALEELLARVRAILRRRGGLTPEVLEYADLRLDTAAREAYRGNRAIQLTTTEYGLLLLFLRNPRHVLSRDLIMDRVWGYDYDGESNVLEVHIGNLRQKLESGGEKRLIHTVRGAGYVLRDPDIPNR